MSLGMLTWIWGGKVGLLVMFTWIWGGQAVSWAHSPGSGSSASHIAPSLQKRATRAEDGVLLCAQLWRKAACPPDPKHQPCCLFYLPNQTNFLSILSDFLPDRIFTFTSWPQLPKNVFVQAVQGPCAHGVGLRLRVRIPSSSFPGFVLLPRPVGQTGGRGEGPGGWARPHVFPALQRGDGHGAGVGAGCSFILALCPPVGAGSGSQRRWCPRPR